MKANEELALLIQVYREQIAYSQLKLWLNVIYNPF